jgi:hypothetical protein
VNHVDSSGQSIDVPGTGSVLLTASPGTPYPHSDQNGLFPGWQTSADISTITYLPGDGRQVCVSGFDGPGTHTYFAQFYVGIETLDMCGNLKSVFRPGETMQFRLTGGLTLNPAPMKLLAAGGSANECTFVPPAPFTPIDINADPFYYTFTFPSSDADILPGCTSGTQHITGHWRVVALDQSCGCNRNDVKFELEADAPGPSSCTLTCPADITVANQPGLCGATVTYTAPSGPGTVTCNHPSGSFFDVGTTTVTCTSTTAPSCTFHVTVNDEELPTITAPPDITVAAGPSCSAFISNLGSPIVGDNCGPTVVSVSAPLNFPLGTTDAIWAVGDNHGHTNTAIQHVTVVDNTAPAVSAVTVTPAVLWPPSHKMADVTLTYSASDNCSTANCTISGITSNEPLNGLGDGNTSADWEIVDSHHVRVRSERSGGGNGRVYTIAIRCVDGGGNATTRTATVKVPHSQRK